MATIKSYSDLQQSKKLADILPLESADMFYADLFVDNNHKYIVHSLESYGFKTFKDTNERTSKRLNFIPCWSLASLLGVLESEIDGEEGETYHLNIEKDGTWWNVWYRELYDEANPIEIESTEDLIDACYKMIIRLHELKML